MMDWIAGILELVSTYLVGDKKRIAFVFAFLCNVCWIAYILRNKVTYGLLLVTIPAAGIAVRNWIKWG